MEGILMVKAIKAIHADCTLKETGRSWTLPFSNFCPYQSNMQLPNNQQCNTRRGAMKLQQLQLYAILLVN